MIVARTRVAPLLAGLWLALASTALAAAPQGKPAVPQGKPAVSHGKPAKPPKLTNPMQVVIVRDSRPGCEPDCAEWISAEGEIVPATPAQFRRVFKVLGQKKLPVFISSNGGNVDAAFAIGREIRKRGLDVAVERTTLEKCENAPGPCDRRTLKDGDSGRPEPIAASCVSSCVFILAAGRERLAPVYGYVGVHQLTAFQTVRLVRRMYRVQRKFENWRFVEKRELVGEQQLSSNTYERDPNYASTRAYFKEMGVDTAKIMPLLLGTRHQDVHRMTADERLATGLVTRVAAGHALLPGAAAAGGARDTAVSDPTGAAAASVPAAPPAWSTAGATTTPLPVAAQNTATQPTVSAGLLVLHRSSDDMLELYLRLKPVPGGSVRPTHYTADIQLSNGRKLTAASTGEDVIDPLYATLARDEFCALRGAGGLSLKVMLTHTDLPSWRRPMLFDVTRVNGDSEFASKHCDKKEEAAKPAPRS